MTYFNPYAGDQGRSREHWLNYLNKATIANYTADSIGGFIARSSREQLAALDDLSDTLKVGFGRANDGLVAVADGIRGLADRRDKSNRLLTYANVYLKEINDGIGEANGWLESMDTRLALGLEEQRIGNVLAENIAERLPIPESEKERHRWITMGLKFFKSAGRDPDFYADALKYFHRAEAAMPEDYFVLRQIGMLHLYAAPLLDLEKAADFLTRAGNYAAVESQPDAVRLGHMLAKSVLQRFRDQPGAPAGEIAAFAVESYRHAAVGRYVQGNFAGALRLVEKAHGLDAGSSALRFLQGKYLAAAGQHELAFAAVSALPTNDETIAAVSADLDLAASVAPRWLPGAMLAAAVPNIPASAASKIAAAAEAKVLAMARGEMVLIPPGSFMMGSARGNDNEGPVTRVTLTKAFSLGKTQVTQRSWVAVMGSNPSHFKGESLPVESVSWDEAMDFCRKLTERERSAGSLPSGYVYTLPTEAQWEYACRAGTTGHYAGEVRAMAWSAENAGGATHVVATKQANAWGLHDMHGNVWEWCADWYADKLPGGRVSDSVSASDGEGAAAGFYRVNRGGGWCGDAAGCRSSARYWDWPGYRLDYLGFRLALSSVP
jgi:formylglycine-generating enzyme required for sulfatase activity